MRAFIAAYLRQRTVLFLVVGGFMLASLLFVQFVSGTGGAPDSFLEAQRRGVGTAQEIAALSAASMRAFNDIARADTAGEYIAALDLVYGEMNRSRSMRENALRLSEDLRRMTATLPDFSSSRARERAVQAINTELTLVVHLLSYNDLLVKTLEALRAKFLGFSEGGEPVSGLVSRMNEEIRAINALNDQFTKTINGI
ncbi:MAG: hypothetical protein HYS43_01410 [Candidatus Liptonbacteria bacterium]|nr:hypothetical protein [Candidatus Liptonbacteria bacterium]